MKSQKAGYCKGSWLFSFMVVRKSIAVENWLYNQVGPAFDALKSDPTRAVTAKQVRTRLAAEHDKAQ